MSELHSESNDRTLGLTVRIKLVDLNHSGTARSSSRRPAAEQVSQECLSAIVGLKSGLTSRPVQAEAKPKNLNDFSHAEICALTGDRVPIADFETHIESCTICANRVELQLDFIEALEVAVYQRRAHPESAKVHGAMLISAPELNFAVCGELEIG